MNLCAQYFTVYLGIALLQTYHNFNPKTEMSAKLQGVLQMAVNTVNFAPMLCILFIGTRMRALQISQNAGSPPWWTQQAMFFCTYAVLLQVCMVLLLPFFTGGSPKVDEDGNVEQPGGHPALVYTVLAARWIALAALYGGATTVVCGLFLMDEVNTMDTRNAGLLPAPPGLGL